MWMEPLFREFKPEFIYQIHQYFVAGGDITINELRKCGSIRW